MSFISKIYLLNYQIHTKTILKLSKGLNVLFGESDQGKSSIIRGIEWVLCNRPLGDGFRKHNTDKTIVGILKGNDKIVREKSKNLNGYILNNEKPHSATRSSVPEDISSALNLSEANIQPQHETFFLVHLSPGQRSKILNEVAAIKKARTEAQK